MFYPNDILKKRKSGFGLAWLAATIGLGGRSSIKSKLTKKEVISCNIVDACQQIVAPEEPLALRLSSNLLCGISRIYQQQFTIHLSDVNLVHHAIKKAFGEIYRAQKNDNVDLPDGVIGVVTGGNINLGIDPDVARVGRMDFEEWDALAGAGQIIQDDYLEIESGVVDSSAILSIGTPQMGRKGLHQAGSGSINLYEPHLENYDFGGMEGDYIFDQIPALPADVPGILEGMDEEMDKLIRESSEGSGGGSKGHFNAGRPSSSNDFGGAGDMGGDDFFMQDFGGGEEENLEDRVARERNEGLLQRPDGTFVRRQSSIGGVDDEGSSRNSKRLSSVEVQVLQGTKRGPKKAKQNIVDPFINLNPDQLATDRKSYSERMELARAQAEMIKFEKAESARALDMIFGVPEGFAPELAKFWKENVQLKPFPSDKAANEQRARKRGIGQIGPDDDEVARKRMKEQNNGAFNFDDLPQQDFGGGDDYGFNGYDDVEIARAASVGRVVLQRQSMPWNVNAGLASSDIGDAVPDVASSHAGSGKRRLSLDSNHLDKSRKTHSLTASPGVSISPGRLISDEIVQLNVGFEDDFGGGSLDSYEKRRALANLEQESQNFLAFVQRKKNEMESNSLFFSDLVSFDQTRIIAANALYQLVSLATKAVVQIQQDEAYGEILISLGDAIVEEGAIQEDAIEDEVLEEEAVEEEEIEEEE